jgi:hypothetical protein
MLYSLTNAEQWGMAVSMQLTPLNRVLTKVIVTQLITKFSAFYGNRRFITVFTRARHCSVSGANITYLRQSCNKTCAFFILRNSDGFGKARAPCSVVQHLFPIQSLSLSLTSSGLGVLPVRPQYLVLQTAILAYIRKINVILIVVMFS